ncbi:MAG: chemotaxis protein CheB [Planctomycetota bacterium]
MEEYAPATDGIAATGRQFIVGIGASAGGLEALEQFFRHAPVDRGLSYIVVQHLSPDFDSLMDQLLGRITTLPIHLIDDGMRVEPNAVYLLPPKKEVILSAGSLLLTHRPAKGELSFPIDSFFRSLAQDTGPRGIAVVLSGTGSDGSRGIVDVHEAGGFVVSQSESSARFDGMPRSACDTGIVDLVTKPEAMGPDLAAYIDSPMVTSRLENADGQFNTDAPSYAILNMIKRRYEIDFSHYKTATISRRIERRLTLSGCESVGEYTKRLRTEAAELDALYRDLLIGVTGFFRDREVFERLENDVIPSLLGRLEPDQEFRAWVVGAATGEEAYSLAILLGEANEKMGRPGGVKIFASDVHAESLDFAGRGVYTGEALAGLTAAQQNRYFTEKVDGYHASPELRKRVVFVHHNAITNAPFTNLDLITCRNVFIYFTQATQKKVLSLFHFGLKAGGVLCLGSSETPGELSHEFEAIDERNRIYRKQRDVSLPVSMRIPLGTIQPSPMTPAATPTSRPSDAVTARDLMGAYDALLSQFVPPSVLVGAGNTLMHTFGAASKFLRVPTGRPSGDVLDMVDPALRTAAAAALRKATPELPASTHAVLPKDDNADDAEHGVRITVRRFEDAACALMMFEAEAPPPPPTEPMDFRVEEVSGQAYEALERELERTKASLQSTLEEAQTTNEELQAANEQLTASNEELQSTNEELHSVNEELYTVNAEHQRKIDELTQLTDDMDNLLNSTNVHTMFLDRQLNIRRFTPGIANTFNLIPQDVGRRLDTFTHNIRYDRLLEKVVQVVNTRQSIEREVQDQHENWYLLRIMPYITRGQVDGAVLTLIDITSLKRAELKLAELSEIVEHSDDAIFRQDVDGTVCTWNRGAEQLFGKPASAVIGNHVEMLGLQCREMQLNQMLSHVARGESLEDVEAVHRRSDGGQVDVALSLSPIRGAGGEVVGASTVAQDVTSYKEAQAKVLEAVRRRDDFLAMLSHELRNPLAAVLNATNLLTEAESERPAFDEAKGVIDHNVRHVARILDDLLDVSRITNDKINLHRGVVELTTLTTDVIECVQHAVDGKRQELHVHSGGEPIFVEGDVGRLQQMQVNLLVNASKYTAEGGRIDYRTEQEGDEAVISVTDNGEGIAADLIDSIFEPFVQAEQTIDRAQGGMGLGLTLVSKVAEAHGGSVSAQSAGRGRGATFSVRLPLTEKRPQRHSGVQAADIDGQRLMIVEDNDGVRKMLQRALQLKGFEVHAVANGGEAVDAATRFNPDVAIIDIGLPDINGYDVARQIRQDPAHRQTLLVAVTGYGRDRDRENARSAGFDVHLVKPIDPDALLRAIAETGDPGAQPIT